MTEYLKSTDEVVAAYVSLRARVILLVRSRAESDGDLPVPHCPAWSVRDLVAHMVGGPEDIIAGRLEGVTTEAWTQAQVDRHRGESLSQLADAWEATIESFDAVLPMIPAPVNSQFVLDAATHEHDLRHALGEPGGRDELAVSVGLGFGLSMADRAMPGLAEELRASGLSEFDLLRACTGRRSHDQLVAMGLDADRLVTLLADSPVAVSSRTVVE